MISADDTPKDFIGRYGKIVCMKVRPKNLIGRDRNLVRMKIRPKDLIGPSDLYVQPE